MIVDIRKDEDCNVCFFAKHSVGDGINEDLYQEIVTVLHNNIKQYNSNMPIEASVGMLMNQYTNFDLEDLNLKSPDPSEYSDEWLNIVGNSRIIVDINKVTLKFLMADEIKKLNDLNDLNEIKQVVAMHMALDIRQLLISMDKSNT